MISAPLQGHRRPSSPGGIWALGWAFGKGSRSLGLGVSLISDGLVWAEESVRRGRESLGV